MNPVLGMPLWPFLVVADFAHQTAMRHKAVSPPARNPGSQEGGCAPRLLGFAVALTKLFHLAGANDVTHLTREKGMAIAANFDLQVASSRVCLELVVAAVANDLSRVVVGMNSFFHNLLPHVDLGPPRTARHYSTALGGNQYKS